MPCSKLVVLLDDHHQPQLHTLAQQLQLPLLNADDLACSQAEYGLGFFQQALGVKELASKAGPVCVDFVTGTAAHRRNMGGGELIVKAMGGSKQQRPSVLDVTAGLGRDSFVLASWGFSVQMLERSPVVASLLADGLLRASQCEDREVQEIASRMRLWQGEAQEYLAQIGDSIAPDIIYLDPMFPPSKKSALVKKDMRAFHAIVGKEQDASELLAAARAKARHRVVVKRPKKSAFLAEQKPSFSLAGKAVRFDVYSLRAFAK
ncbi:class I SAM-dependent methyltransferase [Dasania sp. GY-MA-18]|uniref:Ribosomal RNA small subunit methyltransferase J n=1 Tax=Dasania phycosphaerae TaxID=2950436 RepID=A0A9J6RPH7_9GAMM|nr:MULTISPECIES: class I SAM-dependent methyltransferase [Dasania]MCR8924049.1 class I SAM-dependent methyltransferase [Dasania sp. GY-MA-18]MCZ0866622.1 class I SAM-dependent methyltransferase [Dasania phycosphaerae]MCZ0870207.1 class I SAM-dependent methyltransferase [Dasania phycosphaerae]